ncbi:MAG: prephenate dehydratase [Thiotrichales bacterium]
MSEEQQLTALRLQIDQIDRDLMTLINQRARAAQQVAEVKRAHNAVVATYYRPEREADVLRRIQRDNPGPLDNEEVARLFREIMSACLALEERQTVAYLGPEGTFTQTAALKHFGHSIVTRPMNAINEVFREVEARNCEYGVVPIENSTEGVVNHTLDSFLQSSLKICGEVELRIHQHLLGREAPLDEIERLYSHPQSLAQCREWLDAHLPRAERIHASSNADAARRASREPRAAAIAGESAAEIYGLKVLHANIEDNPENVTRFLVIGHQAVPPSGVDKTSLLVSAANRPGSLYRLLKPFADNRVSLSRIESRPSHCVNWEYVFFLDLLGHIEDSNIKSALAQLGEDAEMVRVLGSYPKAVL